MVTMVHKTKGFVCHHIPKTGGTSIGNWMSNNIGDDIYWVGTRGVRTLARDAETEMFVGRKDSEEYQDWMKWWRKHGGGKNHFPAHQQVSTVKKRLKKFKRTKDLKLWHFIFLRSPYDWLTSLFWHRVNVHSNMDRIYKRHILDSTDHEAAFNNLMDCMLWRKTTNADPIQSFWINSDVEFIGDFSNLEEDFTKIMSRFDIKVENFPVRNTRSKLGKDVYFWENKKLLDKASRLLRKDIKLYEDTFQKEVKYDDGR